MNIITIFNYPNEKKYNNMFKIWLLQALYSKFNTEGIHKIKILTEGINEELINFVKLLNHNDIVIEYKNRKPLYNVPTRWLHNVGFKLYNLCLETEPYIFVDADAIIMTDLNDVVIASKDKPFICVNHQTIPKHTDKFNFKFMNTGFFVVSDTSFMNFDKIYNCKKVFNCPGTDQYLMNNYCRYINYDYTHDNIHYGWNSCGGYKIMINDKIYSYGLPETHIIHVLHYWDVFKPWITQCSIYNSLEQQYLIFENILNKIKFDNLKNVFLLYKQNFIGKQIIYTTNEKIYNYLKIINLKGKTILHKKFQENINYINEL